MSTRAQEVFSFFNLYLCAALTSCLLEHHHHIHALHQKAAQCYDPLTSWKLHMYTRIKTLLKGTTAGLVTTEEVLLFLFTYPAKCKNETLGQVLFFSYH